MPRRWLRPRYSLTTIFLVVTALGTVLGWLCWELRIVRERQAARAWLVARGSLIIDEDPRRAAWEKVVAQHYRKTCSIPWVRRLLGDRAVVGIGLRAELWPESRERIQLSFPEALVGDTAR